MSTNTHRLAIMAGLATSVVLSATASGAPLTKSTNDDGVTTNGRPLFPDPETDWGDLPISDDSIETTLELHAAREQIALSAVWLGPGPNDLAPIIEGGNDGWVDQLRAEVRAMGLTANRRGIEQLLIRSHGNGWADVESWFAPAGDIVVGDDYGARGHTVLNLWPVVDDGDGNLIGEIPYTFSAGMIAAFVAVGSTDPVTVNAQNGIANSLAVMLILEQELPIRFVGFNPAIHNVTGSLVWESIGDGVPVPGTNNTISRIGRAPAGGDPTQITHNSWQNFPSMVRSLGFVLGLDWEQRHPDRDTFIQVNVETLPPAGFPIDVAPANGIDGPGMPTTPLPGAPGLAGADTGPLFWEQSLRATNVPEAPGCGFDLDSIMLLGPFDYTTIGPAHTIRDEFRYVDYNGDGSVDTTPAGPDDRMFSQPLPVFFSECDIAALTETYTQPTPWYYGSDDICFYDLNGDSVQDGRDAELFFNLFTMQDTAADLVPPFSQVDSDDFAAFNGDIVFPGITPFFVQSCVGPSDPALPDDTPWFYGDDDICFYDLNDDEIQDGRDAQIFLALHSSGDPQADITPPWGVVDSQDLEAFQLGAVNGNGVPDTARFLVQACTNIPFDPDTTPWFYGRDPNCPHDLNGDEVLDGNDAAAFEALHAAGNPRADLVVPFGVVDNDDLNAFFNGDPQFFIAAFAIGACELDPGIDGWFYGRDPGCPWDINDDEVQDGQDIQLYFTLFNAGDSSVDVVAPFGSVDNDDLAAFQDGAPGIIPFVPQLCSNIDLPDDFPWFYGKNPDCPHDVTEDELQTGADIIAYQNLWDAGDFAADIVPPFGQIDLADFQAFLQGDAANGIDPFTPGFCGNGPPGPGTRPGRINPG